MGRNLTVSHQNDSQNSIFLPERSTAKGHSSFSQPTHHSWQEGAISESPSTCLSLFTLVIPWDSIKVNFQTHRICFQWLFHTNGLSWLMLWTFLKLSQISSIWPQSTPHLCLSGSRPSTKSSWPWFVAWLLLGTFKHNTSSIHLQITF